MNTFTVLVKSRDKIREIDLEFSRQKTNRLKLYYSLPPEVTMVSNQPSRLLYSISEHEIIRHARRYSGPSKGFTLNKVPDLFLILICELYFLTGPVLLEIFDSFSTRDGNDIFALLQQPLEVFY